MVYYIIIDSIWKILLTSPIVINVPTRAIRFRNKRSFVPVVDKLNSCLPYIKFIIHTTNNNIINNIDQKVKNGQK